MRSNVRYAQKVLFVKNNWVFGDFCLFSPFRQPKLAAFHTWPKRAADFWSRNCLNFSRECVSFNEVCLFLEL